MAYPNWKMPVALRTAIAKAARIDQSQRTWADLSRWCAQNKTSVAAIYSECVTTDACDMLLAAARGGAPRPTLGGGWAKVWGSQATATWLYAYFRRATDSTHRQFNSDLNRNLRQLRPDWFEEAQHVSFRLQAEAIARHVHATGCLPTEPKVVSWMSHVRRGVLVDEHDVLGELGIKDLVFNSDRDRATAAKIEDLISEFQCDPCARLDSLVSPTILATHRAAAKRGRLTSKVLAVYERYGYAWMLYPMADLQKLGLYSLREVKGNLRQFTSNLRAQERIWKATGQLPTAAKFYMLRSSLSARLTDPVYREVLARCDPAFLQKMTAPRPPWVSPRQRFEEKCRGLQRYIRRHKHIPPQSDRLGQWVNSLRNHKTKTHHDLLEAYELKSWVFPS